MRKKLGRVGAGEFSSRQSNKEASQTRDFCAAKNAALRASRPGPSARKLRAPQDDGYGGLSDLSAEARSAKSE